VQEKPREQAKESRRSFSTPSLDSRRYCFMRRTQLILAAAAAMLVLMMVANPAMARGGHFDRGFDHGFNDRFFVNDRFDNNDVFDEDDFDNCDVVRFVDDDEVILECDVD
jgi:hypothetical protein